MYSALHGTQTTLKCSGMDHTAFNLQRTPCRPSHLKHSPDGTSTDWGSQHLMAVLDAERMKGWIDLVGWPPVDSLLTQVVNHQLKVEGATGKVSRPDQRSCLCAMPPTSNYARKHLTKFQTSKAVLFWRKWNQYCDNQQQTVQTVKLSRSSCIISVLSLYESSFSVSSSAIASSKACRTAGHNLTQTKSINIFRNSRIHDHQRKSSS